MKKALFLAIAWPTLLCPAAYGFCVYNAADEVGIHVTVKGSEELEADLGPLEFACCGSRQPGCRAETAEIRLASGGEVACSVPISESAWIVAKVTEVEGKRSAVCRSFSPDPEAMKARLAADRRAGIGTESVPPPSGLDQHDFDLMCNCFDPPPPSWCEDTWCSSCNGDMCTEDRCWDECPGKGFAANP